MSWDIEQPQHGVRAEDVIEFDIDEAKRRVEQRNQERWVGMTCPVVHVAEGVDVEKLLRKAKKPIMVCKLTINGVDHATVNHHMGPYTS